MFERVSQFCHSFNRARLATVLYEKGKSPEEVKNFLFGIDNKGDKR